MNKINDQILEKWQRPDEEILRTRGFPNLLKLFETLPSPIIKYINDDIMEDTGGDLLKHSFLSIRGCVVRWHDEMKMNWSGEDNQANLERQMRIMGHVWG